MKLSLPSAHRAFLAVGEPTRFSKYTPALFVFGILVVLLGALDLVNRLPAAAPDNSTLRAAFAPMGTLAQ